MAKQRSRITDETTCKQAALNVQADIILIGERLDPETGLELIPGFSNQVKFERGITNLPLGLKRVHCRSLRGYLA